MCLGGHRSHPRGGAWHSLVLRYPEAHEIPALPYTSYPTSSHSTITPQSATELTSTLPQRAQHHNTSPRGGCNGDFHGDSILQPTRGTWHRTHLKEFLCGGDHKAGTILSTVLSRELQQFSFRAVEFHGLGLGFLRLCPVLFPSPAAAKFGLVEHRTRTSIFRSSLWNPCFLEFHQ